jgi:L,D-transpeptidase YcbB
MRENSTAPRNCVPALTGLLTAFLIAIPVPSQSNPFDPFTDSGIVTPAEREQRRYEREELYGRLAPQYRSNVPYVSQASINALAGAVDRYRRIVSRGGWPTLGKVTLRPGDTSAEVMKLRQHLAITGDLPPESARGSTFDDELGVALARYQVRNGLRVSGFVDQRTLSALNVPAAERLQQLETNLARVRELMGINDAPRYVLVNVPTFTLQAVDHGTLAIDSKVVVGKPGRATPAISARIVEVNFYPTWSVPDSIARADLIPQIRRDPGYFHREGFNVMRDWKAQPLDPLQVDWHSPEVVSYKFRQDPGPRNALGVVRINMPNKHAVYLHDTPLKQLFGQSARAFSSGCVRVERVFDLVAWLLSEQKGWDLAKVHAQVDGGEQLDVKLKRAVPVHFVYLTAFASDNGIVQFRPDIYGRDRTYAVLDDDQADMAVAEQSRAITP